MDVPKKKVVVYSNGIKHNFGLIELKIGDDVFITVKKFDYTVFVHYRIISLYSEDNCHVVYSKRLYGNDDVNIVEAEYRQNLKDCKNTSTL